MASLPYMQLYIAEYLSDTSHLSALQVGAHMLILMNYWQRGLKPMPEKYLRQIAKCSPSEWHETLDAISPLFHFAEGNVIPKNHYSEFGRPSRGLWRNLKKMIFARDGYICCYCKAIKGPFEIDHRVAVSLGGTNHPLNLCVACRPCNRSKRAKTLDHWMAVVNA